MSLAVAKDAATVRVFHDMMREYSADVAWVDGTEMMSTGSWHCVSYGAACPAIPWLSGEPNSSNENCVCLWLGHPAQDDGVNDCTCTESMPFICEYNLHGVLQRQSSM